MESKSLTIFLNNIKKYNDKLHLVILFGSYATGRQGNFSDIDILIVTKVYSDKLHDELIEAAEDAMAQNDYKELLAPHVVTAQHFQAIKRNHTDFFEAISSEGRELWKAA